LEPPPYPLSPQGGGASRARVAAAVQQSLAAAGGRGLAHRPQRLRPRGEKRWPEVVGCRQEVVKRWLPVAFHPESFFSHPVPHERVRARKHTARTPGGGGPTVQLDGVGGPTPPSLPARGMPRRRLRWSGGCKRRWRSSTAPRPRSRWPRAPPRGPPGPPRCDHSTRKIR